jgi:hypothetical protein
MTAFKHILQVDSKNTSGIVKMRGLKEHGETFRDTLSPIVQQS